MPMRRRTVPHEEQSALTILVDIVQLRQQLFIQHLEVGGTGDSFFEEIGAD